MNQNPESGLFYVLHKTFKSFLSSSSGDRNQYRYIAAAFFLCSAVFLFLGDAGIIQFRGMEEGLEVGKVADKDVIAERDFVYTDEAATRLRIEAERRLVPPVFVVDDRIGSGAITSFNSLKEGFLKLLAENPPAETFKLRIQRDWPQQLSLEEAQAIAAYSAPNQIFSHAGQVLASLFERGVVALPEKGLEEFNPDTVAIRRWVNGRLEYEQISANRLPTLRTALSLARSALQAKKLPKSVYDSAAILVERFLTENTFFDSVLSKGRLDAAEKGVEPVVRRIERGERVIRWPLYTSPSPRDRG